MPDNFYIRNHKVVIQIRFSLSSIIFFGIYCRKIYLYLEFAILSSKYGVDFNLFIIWRALFKKILFRLKIKELSTIN